jgi:DNA-nicking Smr family endonuclease
MGNNFEALRAVASQIKEEARRREELKEKKEQAEARVARETLDFLRTMQKDGVKSAPDVRLRANQKDVPISFSAAMREAGVTPLGVPNRAHHKKTVTTEPLQTIADNKAVLTESLSDEADSTEFLESEDGLSFRRPEVGPDVPRDLRRGRWVVMAQLDLHGMFVEEAREAVSNFLKNAVARELYCVRIIHGKGNGSPQGLSILREKVRRWLKQRNEVVAFAEPHERDGGAGATIVRLRALQRKP